MFGILVDQLTLSSRLLAPRSRRGSLKRRVTPSKLTLRVMGVSGMAVVDEAILTTDLSDGYAVSADGDGDGEGLRLEIRGDGGCR